MRSFVVGLLALALAGLAAGQPADQTAVYSRVRAVVRGYEGLVKQLDLNRLPLSLPRYHDVTDDLDELGAALEGLTRLAASEQPTPEQWQLLEQKLTACEGAYTDLRKASLALRVWAYWDAHDNEKPEWGPAVQEALAPLPQPKGQVDAEATGEVKLQSPPGGVCHAQIVVVPLSKDLRSLQVTRKALRGPAGALAADQITCQPVDYTRLPQEPPAAGEEWWRDRLLTTKPDVAQDLTQAFILTVTIPPTQKPGRYEGPLYLSPANAKAMALRIICEVSAP